MIFHLGCQASPEKHFFPSAWAEAHAAVEAAASMRSKKVGISREGPHQRLRCIFTRLDTDLCDFCELSLVVLRFAAHGAQAADSSLAGGKRFPPMRNGAVRISEVAATDLSMHGWLRALKRNHDGGAGAAGSSACTGCRSAESSPLFRGRSFFRRGC